MTTTRTDEFKGRDLLIEVQEKYEDALREGIRNAERVRELEDAIGEYLLWEPGRKGHAAAHKRLTAVWRTEDQDG